MPIYEYRCKDCHQVFEEWSRHFEDGAADRTCPVCKGTAKRIISNTTFALKGGGWYDTEYGAHKKPDGEAPAASEAAPAGSAETAQGCAPAKCASGACSQAGCAGSAAS